MKTALATLVLGLGLLVPAARAESPVVVELYTSQGCSSCPPADKLMHLLAEREDVIALALHVDYWDYIGWADPFARPSHTVRQKAYAVAGGRKSIYTPQMIVGGQDDVIGAHAMELAELIDAHAAQPSVVTLQANRDGGTLHIDAEFDGAAPGPLVVDLVRYTPSETTRIKRGENAGHTFTYVNIVRDWTTLREWDGRGPLELAVPIEGDLPAVVLVQRAGPGNIVAAARVR
jgi:hypothetical protein